MNGITYNIHNREVVQAASEVFFSNRLIKKILFKMAPANGLNIQKLLMQDLCVFAPTERAVTQGIRGFLIGSTRDGSLDINAIYVCRQSRRQNIGRHLVYGVEHIARGSDCSNSYIWVPNVSGSADFFAKCGYSNVANNPMKAPTEDEIKENPYLRHFWRPDMQRFFKQLDR